MTLHELQIPDAMMGRLKVWARDRAEAIAGRLDFADEGDRLAALVLGAAETQARKRKRSTTERG